jgi:hypothetical protein
MNVISVLPEIKHSLDVKPSGEAFHNQKACAYCVPYVSAMGTSYLRLDEAADSGLFLSLRYLIGKAGSTNVPDHVASPVKVNLIEDPIFDAPMFEEERVMMLASLTKPSLDNVDPELAAGYRAFDAKFLNLIRLTTYRVTAALNGPLYPPKKTTILGACPGHCMCCWSGRDKLYKIMEMKTSHLISCLLYGLDLPLHEHYISEVWFPGNKLRSMLLTLHGRFNDANVRIQEYVAEKCKTVCTGESQSSPSQQEEILEFMPEILEL